MSDCNENSWRWDVALPALQHLQRALMGESQKVKQKGELTSLVSLSQLRERQKVNKQHQGHEGGREETDSTIPHLSWAKDMRKGILF